MQKYMRTGWVFFFLEQGFLYFGQESVFIQQFDGDFIATHRVASAANTSFGKQSWAKDNNTFINSTGTYTREGLEPIKTYGIFWIHTRSGRTELNGETRRCKINSDVDPRGLHSFIKTCHSLTFTPC